jgi:hypothetical protein
VAHCNSLSAGRYFEPVPFPFSRNVRPWKFYMLGRQDLD